MTQKNDPTLFFAAERTLLAWIRTGLAVMGLGFVVARFGLFLRLAAGEKLSDAWHGGSTLIGVALVLLASGSIANAAWQHVRFCKTLDTLQRPPRFCLGSGINFALILAVLGILLAIYIAITPGLSAH
jgi:putative membrane protein